MFMNDVHKKEEIKNIATQDLRKFGIKCRPKKTKPLPIGRHGTKVFNLPLSSLPTQIVTLNTGQQIVVPKLIHRLCSLIQSKIDTEGLFRKEGSKSRQNEIRIILDAGCVLTDDHHVIDIAVILKKFLRQLPEPLIPYNYHELFLRCVLLDENKLEAILLACLLLPQEHLNTLSYLMQFFYEVAEHSKFNKMTAYNLAVVIGPTVFPMDDKISSNPQLRMAKTFELFKLLIENARNIGVLPENVIERVGNNNNNNEEDKKRKKRRSGSLTRMFNGLRKIVSGKSENDPNDIPDLLTPTNSQSKKRRLGHNGISNKKKKDLVSKLPGDTPFTSIRTPVNMNLSGSVERKMQDTSDRVLKERKALWFSKSRSVKNLKQQKSDENLAKTTTGKYLERRWSTVNEICNMRKIKKRNSCGASLEHLKQSTNNKISIITENNEADYVRVPKTEYEQFVNKVQEIEHRLSTFEFENVQSKRPIITTPTTTTTTEEVDSVKNVQTIYEQTLEQSGNLSPTTDKLAKRLSRDLKIRHSLEQKIIRSPSARKIGTIRRRSLEKNNNNSSDNKTKLSRHQSWHTPIKASSTVVSKSHQNNNNAVKTQISCNLSGSSVDHWTSAEGFFTTSVSSTKDNSDSFNDRASLTRLRSQNAGMVMAKARLFDRIKSESSPTTSETSTKRTRTTHSNKIGAVRTVDSRRLSYRVRNLKTEDRRLPKKSISPRRRQQLSQNKRIQIARQLDENLKNCDKENQPKIVLNVDKMKISLKRDCSGQNTPKMSTPYIKKSLHVKSPKRLCRTPGLDRSTPLKALSTPIRQNLV